MAGSLEEYKKKREFGKTPEPSGKKGKKGKKLFVVQMHDASHLHFDFRLEIGGVLKSWAIPKGPSLNPAEKRLAVLTEDHPVEYADFEGVIPEGHYGAGTVMVWDTGTYQNLKEQLSMEEAFQKGRLSFWLTGTRLKGGFALTRFKGKNWLLIKKRDQYAGGSLERKQPRSVISKRTLKEIAQGK